MGLLDILSNPQLIGMAMAGLSRDREAPMNAMKSLGMVENINQQRVEQARQMEEDARKEKERADNLKLIQAITQGQASNAGSLSEALMAMQGIRGLPQAGQQFVPDQQAGTAVDYETGQAFTPQATQPRSDALNNFYTKYALSKQTPQIDISQFPNANPTMALSALSHQQANDPRLKILEMVERAQEKGDTRDWEREKLGLQNENAIKLEGVKAENKPDKKSNYALMFEEAFGRPPANSKEFLAFIKQSKESPNIRVNTGSRERYHYSTDKYGNVWQINQDTREKVNLGVIGRPGTMDFIEKMKQMESGEGGAPVPQTPNYQGGKLQPPKPDPLGLRR